MGALGGIRGAWARERLGVGGRSKCDGATLESLGPGNLGGKRWTEGVGGMPALRVGWALACPQWLLLRVLPSPSHSLQPPSVLPPTHPTTRTRPQKLGMWAGVTPLYWAMFVPAFLNSAPAAGVAAAPFAQALSLVGAQFVSVCKGWCVLHGSGVGWGGGGACSGRMQRLVAACWAAAYHGGASVGISCRLCSSPLLPQGREGGGAASRRGGLRWSETPAVGSRR